MSARFTKRLASLYSTAANAAPKRSNVLLYVGLAAAVPGFGFLAYKQQQSMKPLDYQEVYNAIAANLEQDYDDGSFGPVLVRLAWHASGTYDLASNTGGSNGSTMRFHPESTHGANAGLSKARDFLEPIKQQFPKITYADLWSLAGVTAIQEMGGPVVKWRPGRADLTALGCAPDGRLPDGAKTQDHLRDVFYRMGFNDKEIVALSGAHALGRCHVDRSGFEGPWSYSPITFSNEYFKLMTNETWTPRKWTGPKQFENKLTKTLMMLPSDMALIQDKVFKKFVALYADDQAVFFADFASAFQKLEELGVPFKNDTPMMEFKAS